MTSGPWRAVRGGFVVWLILGAAGCRKPPSPTDTAPLASTVGTTAVDPTAGRQVQIALASTDLAVGHERFAFSILTPGGSLIQYAAAKVTFLKLEGASATPIATVDASYYPARVEAAGLYVAQATFDKAGPWGAEITAILVDGSQILPQRVRFQIQAQPKGVVAGALPPPTTNRTLTTQPDIHRLSSDPSPDPDFYRLTVDEAVASGKPTVIVFATPGHCSSRICGPVLDEVKAVKTAVGDAVNFIHIEVYEQFEPMVLADEMATWGLTTEPWVYVLDADGRVAERLEGSVTAAELGPILRRLVGTLQP
jgi:hypothetical protein